mgnify:CR=1 FL=1
MVLVVGLIVIATNSVPGAAPVAAPSRPSDAADAVASSRIPEAQAEAARAASRGAIERFAQAFCQASEKAGKEQYLVPYFITGHPGSTLKDTVELALYLKRNGMRPRQVQDFIPTPMAVATTMFYTGVDPLTNEPVYTAREMREKRMMKALVFYWDAQHWPLAREALVAANRRDLIGHGPHCLVPPEGARDRVLAQTRGPQNGRRPPPRRGPGNRRP